MDTPFKDICWLILTAFIITLLCPLVFIGLEASLADGSFYFIIMLVCVSIAWSFVLLVSIEAFIRWRRDRRYRRRREREDLRHRFHRQGDGWYTNDGQS